MFEPNFYRATVLHVESSLRGGPGKNSVGRGAGGLSSSAANASSKSSHCPWCSGTVPQHGGPHRRESPVCIAVGAAGEPPPVDPRRAAVRVNHLIRPVPD